MGAQAEVADRGIPDADHAPVAGVADVDDADVALDLAAAAVDRRPIGMVRSEEHTSELQSLMRISYAVFCLKKKTKTNANRVEKPTQINRTRAELIHKQTHKHKTNTQNNRY